MTKRQKLMLEQSEKRQKLNELLALDEMTDEQRGAMESLTARLQQIEPEMRAAIVAEGETEARAATEFGDDPEGRELRALVAGASAGAIFAATLEHRATDGRTAELQTHFGLAPNQVPLAMLRSPVEARAVTPAPGDVGTNQSSRSCAAVFPAVAALPSSASICRPLAVGEAVFPVAHDQRRCRRACRRRRAERNGHRLPRAPRPAPSPLTCYRRAGCRPSFFYSA